MKKGKEIFKILCLIIAVSLTLSACSSGTSKTNSQANSGNEVFELNVANFGTSTGNVGANILEPWGKLVEEKTNGRVKMNIFHGAVLGGASSVLTDVRKGVSHVSYLFSPYYGDTEIFPLTIGDLPFQVSASDVPKYGEIMKEFTNKYHDEMFKDLVPLGFSTGSPSYIFTNKPVRALEDFKGLKIRAASKSDVIDIEAWGAVPVSVPTEELYDSLSKGVIDGVFTSTTQYRDLHLYEVAPYFIEIPYKVIQVVPIMNKATFDKLPQDLKALFENELNPALEALFNEHFTKDSMSAREDLVDILAKKGEIIQFSSEEIARMQQLSRAAWDQWIKDADEKGYPGEEMMKEYGELLKGKNFPLPFYFE